MKTFEGGKKVIAIKIRVKARRGLYKEGVHGRLSESDKGLLLD